MMMNKHLLSGIPAVLLAFVLIFTACEIPLMEVEGTVGLSTQEAPVVTATAVKGGILLEWNPILDASSYVVWRKADGAEALQLSGNPLQDEETGKYRYLDLVSDTNALDANTEYTYTVTASGSAKTTAKTEVKATPTDIPAKGMKLDPVTGVTLTLDPDTETISVSWTPAAGAGAVLVKQYSISIYMDDTSTNLSANVSSGKTKASIAWSSSSQTEGEYAAQVTANAYSTYFKNSDGAVSAARKHEHLFGSGNPSVSGPMAIIDESKTLKGFYATITLNGIAKPEVTYSVERAPVNEAGNAGTYAAVGALYTSAASDAAVLTAANLTADVLGNLKYSTVYDKSLPAASGKYKYRVKAVKGDVTQTKEISSSVTVDPHSQLSGSSISITVVTTDSTTGAKTYAVTPSLTPKGALQTGDKLVIYYVKSASSDDVYKTGPYTQGVEFSKDGLEAASVTENLVIPKATDDAYAYVQAYFVFADGSRQNVTQYISETGGVSNVSNYSVDSDQIYYATLNYQ
jgi:hypothetical protein